MGRLAKLPATVKIQKIYTLKLFDWSHHMSETRERQAVNDSFKIIQKLTKSVDAWPRLLGFGFNFVQRLMNDACPPILQKFKVSKFILTVLRSHLSAFQNYIC